GACTPIVDLIWIQHDDVTGGAGVDRAPIVEHLDARVGQPDGVGIVTMLLVGVAGEPRAEELDASDRARTGDPACASPLARSFKTLARRSGLLKTHHAHP